MSGAGLPGGLSRSRRVLPAAVLTAAVPTALVFLLARVVVAVADMGSNGAAMFLTAGLITGAAASGVIAYRLAPADPLQNGAAAAAVGGVAAQIVLLAVAGARGTGPGVADAVFGLLFIAGQAAVCGMLGAAVARWWSEKDQPAVRRGGDRR